MGPGQGSPGLVLPDHLHPARIGKPWPAFVSLVLTPCHPATWPRHIRGDMCWPMLQLSVDSLTPAPLRAHQRLQQNSEVQCLFHQTLDFIKSTSLHVTRLPFSPNLPSRSPSPPYFLPDAASIAHLLALKPRNSRPLLTRYVLSPDYMRIRSTNIMIMCLQQSLPFLNLRTTQSKSHR